MIAILLFYADVFDGLLRKICASCNLSVVEKVDTNASLHASSLQVSAKSFYPFLGGEITKI